ncbi:MAG: peptidylprolyl isomerase [Alcanivoracaceae bacterium]|nr:peptidylprolyl isomerase [Alcanivoracaceae bacterium]
MPWKRSSSGKGFTRLLPGGGLFILLLMLTINTGHARESTDRTSDDTNTGALVINNLTIPAEAISRMHALVQRDDPTLDRKAFIDALIESHLVASHVREQGLADVVLDSHGVGFAPAVQIDNRQVATLRVLFAEPLAAAVEALGKNGLNALLAAPIDPDWQAVSRALGSPVRHVYSLSPAEQRAAAGVPLAHYQLPGSEQTRTVTLADIYQRQNVQGRIALHEGDHTWLVRETQLYIGQQFVRAWSEEQAPVTGTTLAAINTLVEDRLLRQAWLAHSGVATEIHAGNPALKAASEQVSRAAIQRWYQANRARFRSVLAARASVVRCSDKHACESWLATQGAALQGNEAWPASSSKDVTVTNQWYQRDSTRNWLTDVVLMQPDDKPPAPIRGPGGNSWYLVQVNERKLHTHSVDSLTVDIVARREVAREQLVQDYLGLTARLREQAHIRRPAS